MNKTQENYEDKKQCTEMTDTTKHWFKNYCRTLHLPDNLLKSILFKSKESNTHGDINVGMTFKNKPGWFLTNEKPLICYAFKKEKFAILTTFNNLKKLDAKYRYKEMTQKTYEDTNDRFKPIPINHIFQTGEIAIKINYKTNTATTHV